jgi:hypothetical protein
LFAEPGDHGEKSLRGVRELDETSGAILSQGTEAVHGVVSCRLDQMSEVLRKKESYS